MNKATIRLLNCLHEMSLVTSVRELPSLINWTNNRLVINKVQGVPERKRIPDLCLTPDLHLLANGVERK